MKNADLWEITNKDSKTYNDNIDESKSITATTNFNEQNLIPEESNEVNAREITNTSADYNHQSARPSIKQNIHLMKEKELVVKTKREVEIQNSKTLFQYQTTQDCLDDEEVTLFLADNDAKVEKSSFGLTELIERTEDLSQFDWSINLNF